MRTMRAYVDVLMNAGYYSGRSTRKEFWMFTFINTVVIGVLTSTALVLGHQPIANKPIGIFDAVVTILVLYCLLILFPWLALAVRRLHDSDRSGAYLLLRPFRGHSSNHIPG
ncbi:MAG TPA: DUF805 domain-containing protein [Anaerolineales bacterium]